MKTGVRSCRQILHQIVGQEPIMMRMSS